MRVTSLLLRTVYIVNVIALGEALDRRFFEVNPVFQYCFRTPLPGEVEAMQRDGKVPITARYWICAWRNDSGLIQRKPVCIPLHVRNADAWINMIWIGLEAHEARAGGHAH